MIDLQDVIVKSLQGYDAQRDRSLQVDIGPSSLGGCRRRVWHELKQDEKINPTESLGAILGTFIHSGMEKVMTRLDPFGDNYLIELEISHEGLRGHCDLFIKDLGLVVDFKTTTKSGLRYLNDRQKMWQIHTYGYLLSKNGYDVKEVSLVGIPRDGKMSDIRVVQEPYSELTALEAIAWLDEIKDIVSSDAEPPAPEKFVSFCKDYCPFFNSSGVGGCPSMAK
jgi:CRISPR/Cas system-associated exonuclease Cas4 (RecB family)